MKKQNIFSDDKGCFISWVFILIIGTIFIRVRSSECMMSFSWTGFIILLVQLIVLLVALIATSFICMETIIGKKNSSHISKSFAIVLNIFFSLLFLYTFFIGVYMIRYIPKNLRDQDLESLMNQELTTYTLPENFTELPEIIKLSLNCDQDLDKKALILHEGKEVSEYYWYIQECRRADSVADAEIIINIHETNGHHPTAQWIITLPSGSTRREPVIIPYWDITVYDFTQKNYFIVKMPGDISEGMSLVADLTKSKVKVGDPPVKKFLDFFDLKESLLSSEWNEFFYPELDLLTKIGIIKLQ